MKKPDRYIVFVVLIVLFVTHCGSFGQISDTDSQSQELNMPPAEVATPPVQHTLNDTAGLVENPLHSVAEISRGELRGVWVATVFNLDFPSRQNLSAAAMRQEIDAIAAQTADLGLNAVFFQVRPAGDAFYKSDIFPWSYWLSGTQGLGVADFDPLAYWIEACSANGLELHAWLNPYRIIHTQSNSSNPETLAPGNPVRLRPELAVGWTDSGGNAGLFLDPGHPDARALIIEGVAEIVTKYNVDGIHIDDYFYPGVNFNDSVSFARYGNEMKLDDWRRENVNMLIRGIGAAISELNEKLGKNVRWGVSPTAIWMNESNDPRGIPTTSGQESYHALYADTRLWVTQEWVDYICPQIYWYIGFSIADFESIFNWWTQLCNDYNVDLYIGHAAYREAQDDQPPHWRGEMTRQLEMASNTSGIKGSVFYRFNFLRGATGNSIRDFYTAKDGAPKRLPVIKIDTLTVGTPHQDTVITLSATGSHGYNVTGTSDPDKPLYMNGTEITNRTLEGLFSVFAPLSTGVNVFTFRQEGQNDVTRRITRNTSAPSPPSPSPTPTVTRITTPTYATIISDSAWVYTSNTASGGSNWLMSRGQRDRVVAESSNGLVRLSCGMWISRNSVALSTQRIFTENVLRNGVYSIGADFDMIVWQSDVFAAAYAEFDGQILTVKYGMHTQTPSLTLPHDLSTTVFRSVRSGKDGDTPFHAFTIRDDVKFDGHYIDYENGEFRLHLKKRKALAQGVRPLTGISIVLDPGHGGEDPGAIGPMGRFLPEKELNLINSHKLAERLTALGATVHMTRDTDTDVTLQERVDLSMRVRPDLFISLHVNSIAETTNATNIQGFTVWYQNPGSAEFSQTVLDMMYFINPATNRNRLINQARLFVCRPQWTPSIILEAGFIVNIEDFVWLIDPIQQDKMADATIETILEYFSP